MRIFFFGFNEQGFGKFGLSLLQSGVTGFTEQEFLITCGRILTVERERIGFRSDEFGVIPVEVPVTCVDSLLLFELRVAHVDTVVDTRSVADDERRSVVIFGFDDRVEELLLVGAHSALSNVNVTVTHSDHAEVFLLDSLTAGSEFSDGTGRSGLTRLTAGVGVNFGVENENVDVFAHSENVVKSAVTDIVSPAVAAEDPNGLLDKAVGRRVDLVQGSFKFAARVLYSGRQKFGYLFSRLFGNFRVLSVCEPFGEGLFQLAFSAESESLFDSIGKFCSSLTVSKVDTVTEFGVVFKQAVSPSGTFAFGVLGVRTGRRAAAVNGRATGRVGNYHAVAEHLGNDLDVRSFAAACASARELEQRFAELASLDGGLLDSRSVDFGERFGVFVVSRFFLNDLLERNHNESLFFCGANVGAYAAAETVESGNLDPEFVTLHADSLARSVGDGLFGAFCVKIRSYAGVRTYERALVTLNTVFFYPLRNLYGYAAFFKSGSSGGNGTVGGKSRRRKFVAFESENGMNDVLEVLIAVEFGISRALGCVSPVGGDSDLS